MTGGATDARARLPHPPGTNNEKIPFLIPTLLVSGQEEERSVAVPSTRGFEAPKVVRKEPSTRATDAYAVGATVLDMLDTLQLEDELLRSIGARLVER